MDKKYRTSVRRACELLVRMDSAKDYTTSFAEDALIDREIVEVIDWIVAQAKKAKSC